MGTSGVGQTVTFTNAGGTLRSIPRGFDGHGYGIAQRIQQVSEDVLQLNQGTLYPASLRFEQQGWVKAKDRIRIVRQVLTESVLLAWRELRAPCSQHGAAGCYLVWARDRAKSHSVRCRCKAG
jgi:hypothetical protein